ncbi:MAG TPA: 4-(cytidine 5'-diphospho)-2-C-methyl-D-erythritol kinase [Clostridia bacterium]|nr:4-(cytidine 5'-diphospho)-2-C-methyl-D-erythritol kinase [Clostridia bacterium]
METRAYAKVNLTLDVAGKTADGYHALRTIMLAVDIFDRIALTFDTAGISIEADPPLPEGSAAYRAAEGYLARRGEGGTRALIRRDIPPEAGLGGSSADAAAILRALQSRHHALSDNALDALAAGVGSDVPFLMKGGLALCEGRGEVVTPLPPMEINLLVVKPARGASTREVFARLKPPYPMGTTDGALAAIRGGDLAALLPHVGNALTDAALSLVPEIGSLLARMRRSGAFAVSMTGSGSAVFGIFEDAAAARRAARAFSDVPFARPCRSVYDVV